MIAEIEVILKNLLFHEGQYFLIISLVNRMI